MSSLLPAMAEGGGWVGAGVTVGVVAAGGWVAQALVVVAASLSPAGLFLGLYLFLFMTQHLLNSFVNLC